MKFRVSGSNKDTGARMILEFEAESKAAAERKAGQQGMYVNHVHLVQEGEGEQPPEARKRRRVADDDVGGGGSGMLKLAALVIVLGVVVFVFWGRIREMIGF
jgi:hypothetical protein